MSSNRPNGPNSDALPGPGGRRPNPTNKQPSETNLTPGVNRFLYLKEGVDPPHPQSHAATFFGETALMARDVGFLMKPPRPVPVPERLKIDRLARVENSRGNFPGLGNDQFSVGGTNATPGQTHHFLKPYVEESFEFRIPDQVYKFVNLLCNASSQNPSWTPEDGQTHLRQLVHGNGIFRLRDAICFPAETTHSWSFQRGYIPIFTYLSSEWVTKSTMNTDVNALYGLVHNELDVIRTTLETHMDKLMAARSFKEGTKPLSGKQVFKVFFITIYEYLTRFKKATSTNPEIRALVERLARWFDDWTTALQSSPLFDDECAGYEEAQKALVIDNLRRDKERILHLVRREQTRVVLHGEHQVRRQPGDLDGLIASLQRNCDHDGPGERRRLGPRHDNDYEELRSIRVAPTHSELLCGDDPYLPGNFFEAPHFHDLRSIERLLDIQFRLLREDLTAPLRTAVQRIVSDLQKPNSAITPLSKIIQTSGGRYTDSLNSQESLNFSVFTNITFEPLSFGNRGTSVGIVFDSPPGKARSKRSQERVEYWEQVTKNRLMQDGLVALIWKDLAGVVDVYVGIVTSSARDLVNSARESRSRVSVQVSFFDAVAELRIVQVLQRRRKNCGIVILIESPVLYEGVRPFLEALKRDPERLPFSQYLKHQSKEELNKIHVAPPLYSLTPGYSFELKDLLPSTAGIQSLRLTTNDPRSITHARNQLVQANRLDPSQVDAVLSALTQEISLIQGPPGTGKSYTGLELIKVLIKNQIYPILLVAYTNHALDHMLKGILNADITDKIVRTGFRVDEKLKGFSLDGLVKAQPKTRLDSAVNWAFREMKTVEREMNSLMEKITSRHIPQEELKVYISSTYPSHCQELSDNAPSWVSTLLLQSDGQQDSGDDEQWEAVGNSWNNLSFLDFWVTGQDIKFLDPPDSGATKAGSTNRGATVTSNRYKALFDAEDSSSESTESSEVESLDIDPSVQHQEFILEYMYQHGLDSVPSVSQTTRPLEELQGDPQVWNMSLKERNTLFDTWRTAVSELIRQNQIEGFEELRQKHAYARMYFQETTDQLKVNVLRRSHIIGCTTTGAAKVISLLSGVEPKVMVVEEAGQVLESHILASLVESVQQVVMIGDPLQLRPSVNTYKLATDNPVTGKIYKFDQSLMERLSSTGFPMSQLDVQRRMRPEISSLIKNTLYPALKDYQGVTEYPDVRGMYRNVYFVSHTNREAGGGEDSISKHNEYELDMIHDLVLHLLRQGCYNQEGNIVILAAYLGQIPKIRQKLRGMVTIVVDERDAELLDARGIVEEESTIVQEVKLSQQVIIRTLDNFQGEEGEVIILSLVRNSGTPFNGKQSLQYEGRSPIGFLRSKNRTNVGLSRAKHGLYIFGNAPELARGSKMWADVLQELHASECIGKGIPIACHRHPDYVQWIDQPGKLKTVSPDGGCLRDCLTPLPCGHHCPMKCHPDDPNHITTKCKAPCLRLCPLSHPCDRECWECSKVIGNCRFPIRDVLLPCGHIEPRAPCYLARIPEMIECGVQILKKLPNCEHSARMPCHQEPSTYLCREECGMAFTCCVRSCKSQCGRCQHLSLNSEAPSHQPGPISRTKHAKHLCGQILFCGHACKDECKEGHWCSGTCEGKCQQICSHESCDRPCSAPCEPCMQPCDWKCPHIECPSVCGAACMRLPCDEKCTGRLSCGHPCPSVCGEPCAQQTCKICGRASTPDAVADLMMQTSLHGLKETNALDSMTITLPCRHVFSVKTLDKITRLNEFYEKGENGKWIKPLTPGTPGKIRTRPVCPTCSGRIDSLRYGRVLKNSNLAILQRNVSETLLGRLDGAKSALVAARKGLDDAIIDMVKTCASAKTTHVLTDDARRKIAGRLDRALLKNTDLPLAAKVVQNLEGYHAFSRHDATAWSKVVDKVLEPYREARQLASYQDPSIRAYEASLTDLHQEFREQLERSRFSHFPDTPEELERTALRLARMRIGHLPPRASYRFITDAFWMTINILMQLGLTIRKASDEARRLEPSSNNLSAWEMLAEFFLLRAVKDTETACKLATDSESWNRAVKCQLLLSRTRYELAVHQCQTAINKEEPLDPKAKAELVNMCRQGIKQLKDMRSDVPRKYLARWVRSDRLLKREWVDANFLRPLSVLRERWEVLKQAAKSETWNQGLTSGERMAGLDAMMKGTENESSDHTRYFHQCPNGHPYTVAECGNAVGTSTCPECGAWIRRSGH